MGLSLIHICLAHAYKTPLTAIRAASTGLGEMGRLSAAQAELVGLISEQAGALNDLTTRLLTTARLDAGEIAVNAAPVGVGPLVDVYKRQGPTSRAGTQRASEGRRATCTHRSR